MKDKINKLLVIFTIIIGIMIAKSNFAYADTSAYYLGSKDATKATGYNQAKDSNGNNIEATLDMSSQLDKMLYYILTYEEYDNKTYVGDSSLLNLEERRQAAIYYLVHNYKQNINQYSNFTSNEKLKAIFENYTGSGNNLSEFDDKTRNGVQVIYGLSEAWAKGEDMAKAAQKLKINYKALSDDNFKYWASITEEPLEGSIYNPSSEDNTLIVNVYLPKEEEKTAQNAIKVVEKEIVEEKKELIKNLIKSKGVTIGSINNLIDNLKTDQNSIAIQNVGANLSTGIINYRNGNYYGICDSYADYYNHKATAAYPNRMLIPRGYYCMDHSKSTANNYVYDATVNISGNNKYVLYDIFSYSWGANQASSTGGVYIEQVAYWKYKGTTNTTDIRGDWDGVDSSVQTSGSNLYNEAKNKQAPSVTNESSNPSCTYENGSYWYGPFKIKYSNLLRGDSLSLKLGSTNVSLSNCYSSKSSSTSLSNITSNSTFYIKSSTAGYNNLNVNWKDIQTAYYKMYEGAYVPDAQPIMKPHFTTKTNSTNITIKTTEQYNIALVKKSSVGGATLKGAIFTIAGKTNQQTDDNGKITISNQEPSGSSTTIKVQETHAPTGYMRDNTEEISITVNFNTSNQSRISSIKIGKTTINSNSWTKVQDKNGNEIKGYRFALNSNTIKIEVTDTPYITPTIKVKKVDQDGKVITTKDAEFTVGNSTKKSTASNGFVEFEKDKYEKTLSKLKYNGSGSIKITETHAPTGYDINGDEVTVSYSCNDKGVLSASVPEKTKGYKVDVSVTTIIVTVTDDIKTIKPKVKIKKVNKRDDKILLDGFKFKVGTEERITGESGASTGYTKAVGLGTLKWGENGKTITIQETEAKEGYKINNNSLVTLTYGYEKGKLTASLNSDKDYSCEIDPNNDDVIIVTVKDSQIYNLNITKVNKNNTKQVIPNVGFNVADGANGKINDKNKPTGNGNIGTTFGMITYQNIEITQNSFNITIKETGTKPNNLTIDYEGEITIPITVDQKAGTISIKDTYKDKTNGIYDVKVSKDGHTINVVVRDTPYITPKLKITKVDSTNSNTKLRWCKV